MSCDLDDELFDGLSDERRENLGQCKTDEDARMALLLADALAEVQGDDQLVERLAIEVGPDEGTKIEEAGDVVTWWRVPTIGALARRALWQLRDGVDEATVRRLVIRWKRTGDDGGWSPPEVIDLLELFETLAEWRPRRRADATDGSAQPTAP